MGSLDYPSDPSDTPDIPFGTGTSDELSPDDLHFINFPDLKALLVEQIRIDDDDVDDTPSENLDESSVDSSPDTDRKTMTILSDTDRQILQTLQGLYSPDRHINMARSENSTTVINTTSYTKLIFDSGADTSVLGENWSIQEILILLVLIHIVLARKLCVFVQQTPFLNILHMDLFL